MRAGFDSLARNNNRRNKVMEKLKKLTLRSKLTTILLTDEINGKTNVDNFVNFDNFDNFKKKFDNF